VVEVIMKPFLIEREALAKRASQIVDAVRG